MPCAGRRGIRRWCFVDNNFVGNRKAAKDMLPHLVAWQKQHDYPMQFSCEATLNIAKQTEILELMREASFLGSLRRHRDAGGRRAQGHAQGSQQRRADDEVDRNPQQLRSRRSTSGIILGLDTDTADTEHRLTDFIELSNIPMLTMNLLQALPKTPLWDRLDRRRGGCRIDSALEKRRALPATLRSEVVGRWRATRSPTRYDPERLFQRFHHQVETTYVNRNCAGGRRSPGHNAKFAAHLVRRP